MTKDEIDNLTEDQLKTFARAVDLPTVPPEQPNFEYKEDKKEEEREGVEEIDKGKKSVKDGGVPEDEEMEETDQETIQEKENETEEKEEEKMEEAAEEEEEKSHGHDHHEHDEL